MCNKGPSSAQNNISTATGNFYSELRSAYSTEFGSMTSILKNIRDAWTPILNGGPNQHGFSPAELAARTSSAINSVATNYKGASAAVNEQLAARGGGNTFLPSGADAQINAEVATRAAQQLSSEENQITQADYATGRANFSAASGALSDAVSRLNPNGTAGVAGGVGDTAFKQATQIYQENVANNAWQNQLLSAGINAGEAFLTGGMSTLFKGALSGKDDGTAGGTITS